MSDIPKDVMAAARKVRDVLSREANWDLVPEHIARAILAEREACAKLVDCGCDNPGCELDEAAARIRSQR